MICNKCGVEVDPNDSFCSNCGAPVEAEEVICTNCGAKMRADSVVCPSCGLSTGRSRTRYCTRCGANMSEHDTFCPSCGQASGSAGFGSAARGSDTYRKMVARETQSIGKAIDVLLVLGIIACILASLTLIIIGAVDMGNHPWDTTPGGVILGEGIGCLIALAWLIPMRKYAKRCINSGRTTGTAFNVCAFFFLSLIICVLLFIRDNKITSAYRGF